MKKFCLLSLMAIVFTGCSPVHTEAQNISQKTSSSPSSELTAAQLTSGKDPALSKAYHEYQKTGVPKTIETDQFIQFPYDAGFQPIIAASILELTVISLEPGEQVSSVSSGDPLRWSYSLVYSGSGAQRQAHVLIKPAKIAMSTDFFITTDRRAYLLKITSTPSAKSNREVRFWYPDKQSVLIAELPNIDINQLNFHYQLELTGQKPSWLPIRVFDDGTHTYVEMPSEITSKDLPVLFVANGNSKEIVNYRFKTPYFIVDKIFAKAILLSGVGREQQQVIINRDQKLGG